MVLWSGLGVMFRKKLVVYEALYAKIAKSKGLCKVQDVDAKR